MKDKVVMVITKGPVHFNFALWWCETLKADLVQREYNVSAPLIAEMIQILQLKCKYRKIGFEVFYPKTLEA